MGDFLGRTKRVSFGSFTLDTGTRLLLRGSDQQPVHLTPKAYELLCVLIDTRPRAVTKGELHERLWPSTFVSEATLASLVGELREALGERGRQTRFIRTVHGFGYAFTAEVEERDQPQPVVFRNWIVVGGCEKGLPEGAHVIGRDPSVAITLASPTVSRHHARIVIAGDMATLEDLDSKNGTYLRGQAVTTREQLADGDEIRVGAFTLVFRVLSALGPTDTAK